MHANDLSAPELRANRGTEWCDDLAASVERAVTPARKRLFRNATTVVSASISVFFEIIDADSDGPRASLCDLILVCFVLSDSLLGFVYEPRSCSVNPLFQL